MIYNDPEAKWDTQASPGDRSASCLHCGLKWGTHYHWRCSTFYFVGCPTDFDLVPHTKRFLTQKMKDSVQEPEAAPPTLREGKGISSSPITWRDWVNSGPGECPCGINRKACDYHK